MRITIINTLYVLAILCLCLPFYGVAKHHALLIGINDYQNESVTDLAGPKNDVQALLEILPLWGVDRSEIDVLVDRDATRANILKALNALNRKSKPGDMVFIYFSGHGSSIYDDKGVGKRLTGYISQGTGVFLPYDAQTSGHPKVILDSLIIGQTDLQPILRKLDENRTVFVVMDACFSENSARNFSSGFEHRNFTSKTVRIPIEVLASADKSTTRNAENIDEEYPYKNTVFLAASSKSEEALDDTYGISTFDGKPRSIFTDAMLRVMHGEVYSDFNRDGQLSYAELYKAVGTFMADYPHSPKLSYKPGTTIIDLPVFAALNRDILNRVKPENTQKIEPLKLYSQQSLAQLPVFLAKDKRIEMTTSIMSADYALLVKSGHFIFSTAKGEVIKQFKVYQNDQIKGFLYAHHWLKNLRELPEAGGHNVVLDLSLGQGITGKIGEQMDFVINADHEVSLWLLAMDSNGKVSVLYPESAKDFQERKLGVIRPFSAIERVEPTGEDWLIAIGFKEKLKAMRPFINGSFTAGDIDSDLFLQRLQENSHLLSKHEVRLITVR